jgi:hypothetical protein
MGGMIAVDDVIASLPKERQKKIAARRDDLLAKTFFSLTPDLSPARKKRRAKRLRSP